MEQRSQAKTSDVSNTYEADLKASSPHEIIEYLFFEQEKAFDAIMEKLKRAKANTNFEGDFSEARKVLRELQKAAAIDKIRTKKIIYLMAHHEALPVGISKEEIFKILDNDDFLPEALIDSNPEMGSR